jgi:hypothetical protein
VAERAVWPHRVVVDAPSLDDLLRLGDAQKPVLIQAVVAKLAVEAFDVGVLHRLAGRTKREAR